MTTWERTETVYVASECDETKMSEMECDEEVRILDAAPIRSNRSWLRRSLKGADLVLKSKTSDDTCVCPYL